MQHDNRKQALEKLEGIIRNLRAWGDRMALGRALHQSAGLLLELGEAARADAYLAEAASLLEESEDVPALGAVQRAQALSALQQQRYPDALEHFRKAGETLARAGNLDGKALCLAGAGSVCLEQRDPARARELFEQALALFQQTGNPVRQGQVLLDLGRVHHTSKEYELAVQRFMEAATLLGQAQNPAGHGFALLWGGQSFLVLGRREEARARFAEAAEVLHRAGDEEGEAEARTWLAQVRAQDGETE
jgi:tetratricopeptide (TPR) repeat protein